MTEKATSYLKAEDVTTPAAHRLTLDAQERHIRRRRVQLNDGTFILVDLEKPVQLADGDCLVLEKGELVEIQAAREDLLEIAAGTPAGLVKLAWHIGNRHLEAQIEESRILIRPDHVIAHMLEHQGALVREVREPFSPENGAYAHDIGHEHSHSLTATQGRQHRHDEPPGHPHHHDDDDGDND